MISREGLTDGHWKEVRRRDFWLESPNRMLEASMVIRRPRRGGGTQSDTKARVLAKLAGRTLAKIRWFGGKLRRPGVRPR